MINIRPYRETDKYFVQRVCLQTVNDDIVFEGLNRVNAELFLTNMLDYGYLSPDQARLIRAAVSESSLSALPPAVRDFVRADLLKNMLISVASE